MAPKYIAMPLLWIWDSCGGCFPSAEDQEKNDESYFTWRDYASKIFSSIMSRHIDTSTIIFVNDPYDVAESFKSEEHAKRKSNLYIYGS